MNQHVSFYYDFVSPYSYLAYTQLEGIKQKTGAEIKFMPVHVLSLMEKAGNTPTSMTCKAKGLYSKADLGRWASQYKIPLKPHPRFGEFSTLPLLLGALAADELGNKERYIKATFEAIWVNAAPVDESDSFVDWLFNAGVTKAEEIWRKKDEYVSQLQTNQNIAIQDGVFGVPSFKTLQNLYFGNDRLHFLQAELAQ